MDHVKGRISDTIYLPSGRHLGSVTIIFDSFPDAVKRFQVHQNKDYSIVIQVVLNCSEKKLTEILAKVTVSFREKTFSKVHITTEVVQEITLIRGKLRFITSDL